MGIGGGVVMSVIWFGLVEWGACCLCGGLVCSEGGGWLWSAGCVDVCVGEGTCGRGGDGGGWEGGEGMRREMYG